MSDDQVISASQQLATKALEAADQEAIEAGGAAKLPEPSAKKLGVGDSAAKTRADEDLSEQDEIDQSDELATTLTALQNVIERHAQNLQKIQKDIKLRRDSLRSVFENDAQLAEAQQQVNEISTQLKTRKTQLESDPQATTLKVQIGELNEQKKELEEALSNHLVNYYQLTNSKSFDTSDGDQWDFEVHAKVKPRKSKQDD